MEYLVGNEETEERNDRQQWILLGVVFAFVFINAAALSFVIDSRVDFTHFYAPLIWLAAIILAGAALSRWRPQRDPLLLPLFALLTGWGIVLLDRLAPNFLGRQIIWIVVGIAAMLAAAILPKSMRPLRRFRYTLLSAGLLVLATTLIFGVNPSGYGATLWLPVPFLGQVFFQPSELLKLLLVIFLASYFDEREAMLRLSARSGARFGPLPYLAPLLLMWGFCIVLLVWQQDLGAATLFFILFLALLYLATGDWRYMISGTGLLIVASIFAYVVFDVVALRIDAWWNPWPDANDRAFQIVQSLYALANSAVAGQGIGQGFPEYIPVVHSDFVFAAVTEEWGMVGALGLVCCFGLLVHRGFRIAISARRSFDMYLSAGITVLFGAQALLIMGGVTKLLPLTGVTLPFISYGGSSLLVSSVMIGLLLYLSSES